MSQNTISIRSNIAFERKGAGGKGGLTDINGLPIGEFNYRLNFEYLTLPILVHVTFGKKVNFFINGSGFFSYLIKQTSVIKTNNKIYIYDITYLDKRFDTGITAGLGIAMGQ